MENFLILAYITCFHADKSISSPCSFIPNREFHGISPGKSPIAYRVLRKNAYLNWSFYSGRSHEESGGQSKSLGVENLSESITFDSAHNVTLAIGV